MTRKPVTIKSVAIKAAVKTIVAFCLAASALMLVSIEASTNAPGTVIPGATDGNYGRPNAEGSPIDLVEKNKCWTGEAPAGVTVPGHVVARLEGESLSKVYGAKVVGQALEQIFEGKDHGITVHGFCR